MALPQNFHQGFTRRRFLMNMGMSPVLLRSAPFAGIFSIFDPPIAAAAPDHFSLSDPRYIPHYPARSPLEAVLRLVPPLIVRDPECNEALALLDRAARRCLPALLQDAAK